VTTPIEEFFLFCFGDRSIAGPPRPFVSYAEPPIEHRWKPGQSGNPNGYSRGRRITDELVKMIAANSADVALARVWFRKALEGDPTFFRLLIDRYEDPVPRAIELSGGITAAMLGPAENPLDVTPDDPERWDWYATTCPCGLEPGSCKKHPRAREPQRPPYGEWRTWAYIAGRGAGKTRSGAEWVQSRVDSGLMKIGMLIAPTAADIRDVMIEGPSGILAIAPPDNVPRFETSKRRITWPNGSRAVCLSGEEPDRARGHNVDTLWADELAAWQRPEMTWDLAVLALRAGTDPRAMITTTPRRVAVLKRILAEPTTVRTSETTFDNTAHLAEAFMAQIVGLYEGTRLGMQELYAEFLETTDGVWFVRFNPKKHVTADAEYDDRYPVRLAIDAGTSRHTFAVWFQVKPSDQKLPRINVFGEYHGIDQTSMAHALAIKTLGENLESRGRTDLVRMDPAATARSSLGPAAYGEYERVFGSRFLARWPQHLVLDGLDTIEMLLDSDKLTIHPRCKKLKEAFLNYSRKKRGSEWIDFPADGHPEEDAMDALRGGIRDALPEGRQADMNLSWRHAARI
jgi:hypothetical protein